MKKISTSVILLVAAVILAVSCKKEVEPKVPESKLVGVWKAPFTMSDNAIGDFSGKYLIINENHTATFNILSFNSWKIEDDELILTNYHGEGPARHVEVLRYTINNFADTTMLLTGKYIYAVGDSVCLEGDLSGLFKRDRTPSAQ